MRQALILLSVSVLFTSCATLKNEPYMNIFVHTTETSRLVFEEDTIKTSNNKARIEVERKNNALQNEKPASPKSRPSAGVQINMRMPTELWGTMLALFKSWI